MTLQRDSIEPSLVLGDTRMDSNVQEDKADLDSWPIPHSAHQA